VSPSPRKSSGRSLSRFVRIHFSRSRIRSGSGDPAGTSSAMLNVLTCPNNNSSPPLRCGAQGRAYRTESHARGTHLSSNFKYKEQWVAAGLTVGTASAEGGSSAGGTALAAMMPSVPGSAETVFATSTMGGTASAPPRKEPDELTTCRVSVFGERAALAPPTWV
jgi:hypothetical protein